MLIQKCIKTHKRNSSRMRCCCICFFSRVKLRQKTDTISLACSVQLDSQQFSNNEIFGKSDLSSYSAVQQTIYLKQAYSRLIWRGIAPLTGSSQSVICDCKRSRQKLNLVSECCDMQLMVSYSIMNLRMLRFLVFCIKRERNLKSDLFSLPNPQCPNPMPTKMKFQILVRICRHDFSFGITCHCPS